jgi:hypothetical protein
MAISLAHGNPGDSAAQIREVEAFNNYFDGITDSMAPTIAAQGIEMGRLSLSGFDSIDTMQRPAPGSFVAGIERDVQSYGQQFAQMMASPGLSNYWSEQPVQQRAPAGSALDVGQSLLGAFGSSAPKAPAVEEGITGIGGLNAAFNAAKTPEPQGSRADRYRQSITGTKLT